MMLSIVNTIFCAAVAVTFWLCIGLPAAMRFFGPARAVLLALGLGWAIHNAATLPIFMLAGLTPTTVYAVNAGVLGIALAMSILQLRAGMRPAIAPVMAMAFVAAALLALVPASAILPKVSADGVALAGPIFDHSKIAMIDDMARFGLPPGNPFFHEGSEPSRLAYYYLWHAGAAQLSLMTGVSAWEADAGLTWVTALAAILLVAALASLIAQKNAAALWAVALCAAGSLRPVLEFLFGAKPVAEFIWPANGFGNFLFQASWVPQHTASATSVVLAGLLIVELARRPDKLTLVLLGLVAAAAVQSSVWIGGVTFAISAVAVGAVLLISMPRAVRPRFVRHCAFAATLAALLAFPVLKDQLIATGLREGGSPIALHHYEVLGELVPERWRRLLDVPAFWLIQLPVEFPAIFLTGIVALAGKLRRSPSCPEGADLTRALAAFTAASLATSWLLASTIGNNDLGWRAVLPGMMVLTAFGAAGLASWIAGRQFRFAIPACLALGLGLPDGIRLSYRNATGELRPSSREFANTPQMWAAVRRHAQPEERVGNNPLHMWDITPWPVNLSWALFGGRRSCFASHELVLAYVSLPRQRRLDLERQFIRVFDGDGTQDDIRDMALRYGCSVVLLTAQDKAWLRDPFADSAYYRMVESKADEWRIYRRKETIGR